jgi:MerR family redox-sensitive transcriptional activator SoxR
MTIGQVAERAGVAASSIRYYESIGLLPEPERLHGQRRYGSDVLGRLAFVGVAQGAGFKLREIKQLVDGLDGGSAMADQMRMLSSPKLEEVEELLARTKAIKGWLDVAKECGCTTPQECALFPDGTEVVDVDAALTVVHVTAATAVGVEPPTCARESGRASVASRNFWRRRPSRRGRRSLWLGA